MTHIFALPPQPVVRDASTLKQSLTAELDRQDITLDGTAVTRIDTAGLQLLLAFVIDRQRAGLATRWHSPTPALRDAAELAGLAEALGLPQSLP